VRTRSWHRDGGMVALDNSDMEAIAALDEGESGRTGPNPDTFDYVPG